LHSAVLLEQAACCYLLSGPPMLRKYGFHLILAGNSYYISDQVCNNNFAIMNIVDVDWNFVEYLLFFSKCRNNMLFEYTEMHCLFTNNILGLTSVIMYILMLGGRCIFLGLN
jgi:hypothetical protein